MRLISYKMTHDTGFAPNPFFGVLTLATCKAYIRRSSTRKKGDWIAGFGSKDMCGDEVGKERLIFLMEVTEKPLSIEQYYYDYEYKQPVLPENINDEKPVRKGCGGSLQMPHNAVADFRKVCGDNIYKPICKSPQNPDDFEVLPNKHHPSHIPKFKKQDILGKNVLISTNFFYFGGKYQSDAGLILSDDVRPNLARGMARFGTITEGDPIRLIEYIQYHFKKPGIYGRPFSWPENDESWKNDENYI